MTLIHPRMLENLYNFYPSAGTVQDATMALDSYGEPLPTWADFLTIWCRVSPVSGKEDRRSDQTVAIGSHMIAVRSYEPTIAVEMRILVDAVYYNILAVEHDGNAASTRLRVEVVK